MSSRWLILADDLTGAADCAIAFGKRGSRAVVAWEGGAVADADVLAIDVDSRRLGGAGADAQVKALARHLRPGVRFYKKIDSTLRGQPFAELAAQLTVLAKGHGGRAPLALVVPAFPAAGRTTVGGRVLVGGLRLEETPLWARDHSYPNACLPDILNASGVSSDLIGIETIHAGIAAVRDRLTEAAAEGKGAVVCDGATPEDLSVVAAAALGLSTDLVWVGSAGLAGALAVLETPDGGHPFPLPRHEGPVLAVVGSLAEASRGQAARLVEEGRVFHVPVPPDALFAGPGDAGWQAAVEALSRGLREDRDVLLEIALVGNPDLGQGPSLVAHLAEMVGPLASSIGALVATGGDTACAILSRMGVRGIRLIDEVEPGVPLGATVSDRPIPVVTKAGGFGDAETLRRCLDRLKA